MCPFCQTLGLVLRLRVDFVLPLSQVQLKQEEPPTKIYQKEASLKIGTQIKLSDPVTTTIVVFSSALPKLNPKTFLNDTLQGSTTDWHT